MRASTAGISYAPDGYELLSNSIASNRYSCIFIFCDSNTQTYCMPRFLRMLAIDVRIEVIECEAGESAKTIDTCVQLWNVLAELGGDRRSLVVNLGGGVITDLGGFVASTFKRGIDFINVPTTLLAMVDAAIGGKNGVDLGHLKNQIGLITSAELIVIDPDFLETLPQREMRSGLAEMLKHGLIYDKNYWDEFKALDAVDAAEMPRLIRRSVEIKNEIVTQDESENGIRKALNFGHTLGHAIESHFIAKDDANALLHGEAVAVGMILESYLSMQQGLLGAEEYSTIKSRIASIFGRIDFSEADVDAIIALLIHDKKNEHGRILFALLDGIGKTSLDQQVENKLIKEAFSDYKY